MKRIMIGVFIAFTAFWIYFHKTVDTRLSPPELARGITQPPMAKPMEGSSFASANRKNQNAAMDTAKTGSTASSFEQTASIGAAKKTVTIQDSRGHLILMGQAEALRACAERGMLLPTARELVSIIKSWGGKGIIEAPEEPYAYVVARNPDGKVEEFYYRDEGFVLPATELGKLKKHEIMSSSVDAHPDYRSDIPCAITLSIVSDGSGLALRCSGIYDDQSRQAVPDLARDNHSAVLCREKGP
jgi:hypothetical protein